MRRRNFLPQESRGLSSVWQQPNSEPQPSSDAPTRPISGLDSRNAAYAAYAPYPNVPPQSSFMNIQVDELATDNVEAMPVLTPESLVPAPSLDIPDSRVASRYHMQRIGATPNFYFRGPAGAGPVPLGPDKLYTERSKLPTDRPVSRDMHLPAELLQQTKDLYVALRVAGLSVPTSPAQPMQPFEIIEAVRYLFRKVSPLPHDYAFTIHGTVKLIELLGYPTEKLEVGAFALRGPHLQTGWPHVLEVLCWLVELTEATGGDASNEPLGVDALTELFTSEGNMTSEEYLEFAEISAFSLRAQNGNEPIPDGYFSEVQETLKAYSTEMTKRIETHQQTLDALNKEISSLSGSLTGFTEDVQRSESLRRTLTALRNEVAATAAKIDSVRNGSMALQTKVRDLEALEVEDRADMAKHEAEAVRHGISSMHELVELAASYHDLRAKHKQFTNELRDARDKASLQFERPAKSALTSVRMALNEYNEGLDGEFVINGQIPTDLDAILGKTMLSLLGDGSDLSSLRRKWESLEADEQQLLANFEDEATRIEAEIKSLETRTAYNAEQLEHLGSTVRQFEAEKEATSEKIAKLQSQQVAKQERIVRYKRDLELLNNSITVIERENAALLDEEAKRKPEIEESVAQKQHFESKLLEYQHVYTLLEQNLEEVERATSSLCQAKADAEFWLSDLKSHSARGKVPVDNSIEFIRNRARELLNSEDGF